MSEREPITTELRKELERTGRIYDVHKPYCERISTLCDAIDAVHARLEQENDELGKRLGERVLNNKAIVNVKMRIDWESMAEELECATDAIRALAGDDE